MSAPLSVGPRRERAAWGSRYEPAPIPPWLRVRLSRALVTLGMRSYFQVDHVGRKHIPRTGPVVLVSNHPTLCDPFLVAFGTQRWVTWLAVDEALEWPVAGHVMRLYEAIPLNLSRPTPSSIKAAYATLARGRILGLFFEGQRSFTLGLNRPLKSGAARMALRAGAPIVPVTICGGRRLWPREQRLPRPGPIVVRYHPPIDTARFRPDLPHRERAALLTEQLAATISSVLPPCGAPGLWARRRARARAAPE